MPVDATDTVGHITAADRIRAEYARRERAIPGDFYSLCRAPNLFARQQRSRALLRLFAKELVTPLGGKKILDVGCGNGEQLVEFEAWGAHRGDLAGIDLIDTRLAHAVARFGTSHVASPQPDLRLGDASALPWADESFDIVHQSTVFSSILDEDMKRAVAAEVMRVLKPGGAFVWYDFAIDNPRNPHVKGIGARELRAFFPACSIRLRRITLAPPLARRLVPITWIGSLLLEKLVVLNTHYLGIIRKAAGER